MAISKVRAECLIKRVALPWLARNDGPCCGGLHLPTCFAAPGCAPAVSALRIGFSAARLNISTYGSVSKLRACSLLVPAIKGFTPSLLLLIIACIHNIIASIHALFLFALCFSG